MRAVNNGDIQALNGLENRFASAFGSSGPITAQAIADAYGGEVTNVIDKGHITDKGSEKVAHTIDPTRMSVAQMDSVLGAYQNLAQSKMNQLNRQIQSAVSSSQKVNDILSKGKDPFAQFGGQKR